jgi:hypothetical protein
LQITNMFEIFFVWGGGGSLHLSMKKEEYCILIRIFVGRRTWTRSGLVAFYLFPCTHARGSSGLRPVGPSARSFSRLCRLPGSPSCVPDLVASCLAWELGGPRHARMHDFGRRTGTGARTVSQLPGVAFPATASATHHEPLLLLDLQRANDDVSACVGQFTDSHIVTCMVSISPSNFPSQFSPFIFLHDYFEGEGEVNENQECSYQSLRAPPNRLGRTANMPGPARHSSTCRAARKSPPLHKEKKRMQMRLRVTPTAYLSQLIR